MHPQSTMRTCPVCGVIFQVPFPSDRKVYCGHRCGHQRRPLEQRFWAKVAHSSNDPDDCWLWMGSKTSHGYGTINSGGAYGRPRYAHRVAYELQVGPIPAGHDVCHHCDTPACVRGSHLFTGTARDNAQDMMAKGRGGYRAHQGEDHHAARLTVAQVLKIRALAADGAVQRKLAIAFGVSNSTIHSIVTRQSWKHLP